MFRLASFGQPSRPKTTIPSERPPTAPLIPENEAINDI